MDQENLIIVSMLIEQAVSDIRSGKPGLEEWGLGELEEISAAPDVWGTYVARRAEAILSEIMSEPLVRGALLNGQPITRRNISGYPELDSVDSPDIFLPSGKRICVSPRRYEKKYFPGPRRKLN